MLVIQVWLEGIEMKHGMHLYASRKSKMVTQRPFKQVFLGLCGNSVMYFLKADIAPQPNCCAQGNVLLKCKFV